MSQQNNIPKGLTPKEAYQRLIYELYTNGPIKLVSDNGHMDLVNEQVRLCCMKEPFLDVIDAMKMQCLVEEVANEEHDRMYALTDKGFLIALLMHYRRRANVLCDCANCTDAFNEVLRELLSNGWLQLVLRPSGHPHLVGAATQLCCDQKPFLDAISTLESHDLVRMTNDFTYYLTRKGAVTAPILLQPGSNKFNEKALLN